MSWVPALSSFSNYAIYSVIFLKKHNVQFYTCKWKRRWRDDNEECTSVFELNFKSEEKPRNKLFIINFLLLQRSFFYKNRLHWNESEEWRTKHKTTPKQRNMCTPDARFIFGVRERKSLSWELVSLETRTFEDDWVDMCSLERIQEFWLKRILRKVTFHALKIMLGNFDS